MKWSSKKNYEYLCTGSSTNENFLVLIGTNAVQTICIFEILKFRGGGTSEMVATKLEDVCIGSGTNENFSVLNGKNEVQTIGILEILICMGTEDSEMVPQKEL